MSFTQARFQMPEKEEKMDHDPGLIVNAATLFQWLGAVLGTFSIFVLGAFNFRFKKIEDDAKNIWQRIGEDGAATRKELGDIKTAIQDNRNRNADWQERTSAALARLEASMMAPRTCGHAD